jgi:hypothetical protein
LDAHRIRKAKNIYDKSQFYIFLEVEKSRWLQIESLDGVTHDSIHSYLQSERDSGIKIVGFTDRNFQWGTIKDWDHSGVILDLSQNKTSNNTGG